MGKWSIYIPLVHSFPGCTLLALRFSLRAFKIETDLSLMQKSAQRKANSE
jgi:hypothetical protein